MTAALEEGEWSAARPGRTIPPGKTRYPFYRRLGGPQGRSGRAENLVPTGIRPRTVQPVVSRYNDWATRPTNNPVQFQFWFLGDQSTFNSLKAKLNLTCYLLALLGSHHILHVSRIRVKEKLVCIMCFISKCYSILDFFFYSVITIYSWSQISVGLESICNSSNL